ncbi:conserved hypothetical protein [Burkholderia cenocepacia HI2424]|uniref:Uncharacterized protein n=2 Tax=Burkholderia cepacia complex TaxID=87882 RepID=A0A3R9CQ17_9BURK|nr:conserved hypothetical protein [Burkholderia cenocepacia HI2424]PNO65683.1 hypothetical protein DK10_031060 [Burkholderia cenocepacia]RSC10882.1 hypothetical protein EGT41_20975 [Burkholderia cenocepacia]
MCVVAVPPTVLGGEAAGGSTGGCRPEAAGSSISETDGQTTAPLGNPTVGPFPDLGLGNQWPIKSNGRLCIQTGHLLFDAENGWRGSVSTTVPKGCSWTCDRRCSRCRELSCSSLG